VKVVLDTNIIVSAFLNPRGIPAEILSLVLSEKIILCYDNKILSEYTEVLNRSKFNFNNELAADFLEFVKSHGEYILAEPQAIPFIDEDDKMFYEVFKSSDAQYIITGNTRHYPTAKNIVSPREFIETRGTKI
jgi:putative PIN family toxin of toxin-antitoxin system